jgi:hypothetical protein
MKNLTEMCQTGGNAKAGRQINEAAGWQVEDGKLDSGMIFMVAQGWDGYKDELSTMSIWEAVDEGFVTGVAIGDAKRKLGAVILDSAQRFGQPFYAGILASGYPRGAGYDPEDNTLADILALAKEVKVLFGPEDLLDGFAY